MGRNKIAVYDDAYELYLTGLSLAQVGATIGVTRQSVFKAFKKRGFSLRGVNFQPSQYFNGKKFTLRNHGYYALTTDDRCLMHRYVWEFHNGKIPIGYDIHHIDNNKAHNEIINFECLPKAEHTRKYSPHNNQYTKGRNRVAY